MDPSAFPEREKEDAYHFVTYLPINGVLYELDGLRQSPVMHAAVEEDWLGVARETVEERIATYPTGSVSVFRPSTLLTLRQLMFNLLAIRSEAIPRLNRLVSDASAPMEQRITLQDQLEHERTKAARGGVENALRRHNLLPAVFAMFKAMGETGMMGEYGESPVMAG